MVCRAAAPVGRSGPRRFCYRPPRRRPAPGEENGDDEKVCGIEKATRGKFSQVIAFILMWLLGIIGMAIIQSKLNETIDEGQMPRARIA